MLHSLPGRFGLLRMILITTSKSASTAPQCSWVSPRRKSAAYPEFPGLGHTCNRRPAEQVGFTYDDPAYIGGLCLLASAALSN